jgi:hypothetical protein
VKSGAGTLALRGTNAAAGRDRPEGVAVGADVGGSPTMRFFGPEGAERFDFEAFAFDAFPGFQGGVFVG